MAEEDKEWIETHPILLLDLALLTATGVVCGGLWVLHTYLMCHNLTTWELMGRENITYLASMPDNPFDEGCWQNMAYYCCTCHLIQWEPIYSEVQTDLEMDYLTEVSSHSTYNDNDESDF